MIRSPRRVLEPPAGGAQNIACEPAVEDGGPLAYWAGCECLIGTRLVRVSGGRYRRRSNVSWPAFTDEDRLVGLVERTATDALQTNRLRSVVTRGVNSRKPILSRLKWATPTAAGRPNNRERRYASGRHLDLVLGWVEDLVSTGPPVSDISVGREWNRWCPLPGETVRGSGNPESAARARVRSCDRAFSTIYVMPLVARAAISALAESVASVRGGSGSLVLGVGDGGIVVHFQPFGPGLVEGVVSEGVLGGGQVSVVERLLVRPAQPVAHLVS